MEASSKKGSISGSGSQRRTSYIGSFRVGSMSRKNILVASDGKTMDKASLIGSRHTVQVMYSSVFVFNFSFPPQCGGVWR